MTLASNASSNLLAGTSTFLAKPLMSMKIRRRNRTFSSSQSFRIASRSPEATVPRNRRIEPARSVHWVPRKRRRTWCDLRVTGACCKGGFVRSVPLGRSGTTRNVAGQYRQEVRTRQPPCPAPAAASSRPAPPPHRGGSARARHGAGETLSREDVRQPPRPSIQFPPDRVDAVERTRKSQSGGLEDRFLPGPDPEELRPGRLRLPVGPEAPLFRGEVVAGEAPRIAERPDAFDVDADLAELAHGAQRASPPEWLRLKKNGGASPPPSPPRADTSRGFPCSPYASANSPGGTRRYSERRHRSAMRARAEPGARLRADEPLGAGPLVRTQEFAAAALAAGREVDPPDVKVGPWQPRRTGARRPVPAAQRAAYQSSVDRRPSRSVRRGSYPSRSRAFEMSA